MKKTVITLAAFAGLAGAVQAQNVTIYGLLDQAVEHLGSTAAGGGLWRMPGLTGTFSSRIGLRGSEDLGGGLRAVYVLEQGFGLDTGTLNQGGRGWGRQSYVGLAGPWGTVSFGRQYTMLFWSLLDADIIGPSLFGSGSLDSYIPNARVDNAFAWRGRFGGLDLGATYSLGRDSVNAGPSPAGTNCGESADSKACREFSVLAKYDTASWGAALAVDEIRGGPGAFAGLTSSALTDRRTSLNGWARFGALKLAGGVVARDNQGSATTPKSDLWYLAAAYDVTPALVLDGEWLNLKFKNSANQADLYVVRGVYSLSKHTAVYATLGRIANDGTLALSVSGAAAGGGPVAGGSQTGFGAGLRHSF